MDSPLDAAIVAVAVFCAEANDDRPGFTLGDDEGDRWMQLIARLKQVNGPIAAMAAECKLSGVGIDVFTKAILEAADWNRRRADGTE